MPEQISSECSVHCALTKRKGEVGGGVREIRVRRGGDLERERKERVNAGRLRDKK